MNETKPGRRNQPKCAACSHPASFHGGGSREPSDCGALGCHCAEWVEPVGDGSDEDAAATL